MQDSLLPISDIILLEALILGVFSTGGLIFALLLLTGKLQWAREECRALCKVSPQVLIFWGFLTLFPVYFLGVITHQAADKWIDMPSCWHLGLKSLWNKKYDDAKTDDSIKCAMYGRAFGCGQDFCDVEDKAGEKKYVKKAYEWYHQIYSHIVLMQNDSFRKYIGRSQQQVNLMRLGNLVSFVVLVACLLRPLFWLLLYSLYRKLCPEFSLRAVLRVAAIAAVAAMLYVASGKVWAKAERGTSLRVWRFAKSFPEKATAWEMWDKSNRCPPTLTWRQEELKQ